MTQLERIAHMEKLLDEGSAAVRNLLSAIEAYKAAAPGIAELSEYYGSTLWRKDFDDDAAGKLPSGLKRGVLSEDAIYDLLCERDFIERELKSFTAE